jgi:hypothetical protein
VEVAVQERAGLGSGQRSGRVQRRDADLLARACQVVDQHRRRRHVLGLGAVLRPLLVGHHDVEGEDQQEEARAQGTTHRLHLFDVREHRRAVTEHARRRGVEAAQLTGLFVPVRQQPERAGHLRPTVRVLHPLERLLQIAAKLGPLLDHLGGDRDRP